MPVTYRQIAGVSLERLAALSDGIFAVAMTLLVVGISVRSTSALHLSGALTNSQVWAHVLRPLWPHLLVYLMSFLTLGVFWVGQQTQVRHLRRSNRDFTWIHLVFLLCVVLMPFSTTLVADYITTQLAIVVYWLNIALLGAILYAGQRYAKRASLLKEHVTAATVAVMERRNRGPAECGHHASVLGTRPVLTGQVTYSPQPRSARRRRRKRKSARALSSFAAADRLESILDELHRASQPEASHRGEHRR